MPDLKSFHSMFDSQVRAFQTYNQATAWGPGLDAVFVHDRRLSYQFTSHFHPYVTSLIQKLNEGGISSLQDADTLYNSVANPMAGQGPPPLILLPDSTRATLVAAVTAIRPAGLSVALAAGTAITLPDATLVTIPSGTAVTSLSGALSTLPADTTLALSATSIPASSSTGIQFSLAGIGTILPDGTMVTINLPSDSYIALASDGTALSLPANTSVIISRGLPEPSFYEAIFANSSYDPFWDVVKEPGPLKNLDFSFGGAYSIYNWELFFHAPLLIAVHLSQNQKFQDAQTWFHYIFNPTDNSNGPTPQRFWKVQPFQVTDVESIEQALVNLSSNADPALAQQTVESINSWKASPFEPWGVARFRTSAYMLKTVMAYLDNLIAWGDSLFQQYTIETINEATQLYIMAANILGNKPQPVPKKGAVTPLTFNALRARGLDAFSNTLVNMEADIPFDTIPLSTLATDQNGSQTLVSVGQSLYFCVPRNDKMMGYWDTVADRLFKIHNSLNLRGVFQKLPLYDPPIDPALLVRAAAAGLDVSAIVGGLNQPLPLVRFQLLIAKATELCQQVQSLGAGLLSAIEKQDNESLSLMRAQHETTVLGLAEMVKYAQWQDATKAVEGLKASFASAGERYTYYQKLQGLTDASARIAGDLPQLDDMDLDQRGLDDLNYSQGEPAMQYPLTNPDIAKSSASVSDGETKTLSSREAEELSKLSDAQWFHYTAIGIEALGAVLALVPKVRAHASPVGVGASLETGGDHFHWSTGQLAAAASETGNYFSYQAGNAAKIGAYSRRDQEWIFQSNSIRGEINQILKQYRGAQIREAMAKKEYENHQTQMAQAQKVEDFLQGNPVGGFQIKETTTSFYAWMRREIKSLHAKAFQLAFEVAKKAERALQSEIGDSTLSYVQYNYLDGTEGLLAGERLLFDLKSMEMAYLDLNQREYEMTKHVSLLQVDPLALVQLRATGSCTFTMPEEMFDMDGPGHYFRRIKTVALTIPCVIGPWTSVSCTLTLQKSSIRINPELAAKNAYPRTGPDDLRFDDYYGTLQSIVTSSAQADSGLFETNLRDDRYLPFENTGVAGSQWQLSLPSDVRQFDFDTISDVILHVRYSAREGGDVLRTAASANLNTMIERAQTVGSTCLFSIRHEFPSPWAKFQSVTLGGTTTSAELQLPLVPELYPFWSQKILSHLSLKSVDFFAEMPTGSTTNTITVNSAADGSGKSDLLQVNPLLGNQIVGSLSNIDLPAAVTDATHPPLTLYFDTNSMQDLWIAITWGA